jgi:hypothetical protein
MPTRSAVEIVRDATQLRHRRKRRYRYSRRRTRNALRRCHGSRRSGRVQPSAIRARRCRRSPRSRLHRASFARDADRRTRAVRCAVPSCRCLRARTRAHRANGRASDIVALTRIAAFEVHTLKIDQSFIRDLTPLPDDTASFEQLLRWHIVSNSKLWLKVSRRSNSSISCAPPVATRSRLLHLENRRSIVGPA